MGCCETKDRQILPYNLYHNLTMNELSLLLKKNTKFCYLCSGIIPHVYIDVVSCSKCNKMIGHHICIEKWKEKSNYCPICYYPEYIKQNDPRIHDST